MTTPPEEVRTTGPQEAPRYYGYYRYTRGGVVAHAGAGKWIPPVYRGILWWRRVVRAGYWRRVST